MNLTAREERELYGLLEADAAWRREHKITTLFPETGRFRRELYQKSLEFFAAGRTKKLRLLLGGNRCITPWTPLETGNGERLAGEMLGEAVFAVRSWDGGARCMRQASGVFLKGIEPAFRLHLDNGQFVDCSRRHRVLTVAGWLSLAQLIQRASGLHCWHTPVNYSASYDTGDCPGDLSLPVNRDSVGARLPLLSGVQRPDHRSGWHADAVGHKSEYRQSLRGFVPHPSCDAPEQIAALCAQYADPSEQHGSQWHPVIRQAVQQWLLAYGPHLTALAVVLGQCLDGEHDTLLGYECLSWLGNSAQVCGAGPTGVRNWQWKPPGQSMQGWWHDVEHTSIFFPYTHLPLIGGNRISSVVPIGLQPIIDFTVPGSNCYESGGVIHHNTGKTQSGIYECVLHATGKYETYAPWWQGKQFTAPVKIWACGNTDEKIKETLQEELLGPPGAWGTGILPREDIAQIERAASPIRDLVDTVRVRHVSGGVSVIQFKSYKQGRKNFEGTAQDVIYGDEEMPIEIETECLLRTMDTTGTGSRSGILLQTFTPLQGLTPTVMAYLPNGELPTGPQEGLRYVVCVAWDDVPHLTEADKATMRAGMLPYQRDARERGLPYLGAGMILPFPEGDYLVEPFTIPKHWRRCYGMDVGWNRTACPWGAYDPDTDCWYLYSEHYRGEAEPSHHALAIKERGAWIPGVIDPAANGRSQIDGERLLVTYRALGLDLTMADNARYAGIYEMCDRIGTGRLKVFTTMSNWRQEARTFIRDEKGRIVNEHDFHLMAATRYLLLSGGEVAKETPIVKDATERTRPRMAHAATWMGG